MTSNSSSPKRTPNDFVLQINKLIKISNREYGFSLITLTVQFHSLKMLKFPHAAFLCSEFPFQVPDFEFYVVSTASSV